ncbi:hypothetical protein MPTK1_6g01040 [Marchantia polymorpha subsp. ruderalis]|uniref:Uncharacterized protein n=2 Tax=Marchantia polymorpha TaxID=3197 RepID=A0AAF6BM93_MARPO|nr:hypothetical protein MARPO_0052s0100 [Marchantia polymorpha]BBN13127.1 hypothetical protein Mp_6g01040 [Marchantia polymorpha subsp. ruderalis]|eukprot:PTQ38321.1 hypothetical protein MARPO_0052s0100 [Marchantia polymorpha]
MTMPHFARWKRIRRQTSSVSGMTKICSAHRYTSSWRQLKEMLAGKRRRKLPKVDMIDHAALEIDIQISGCFLSYGVMDGVSGVNIKIEAIAHQFDSSQLETTRTVKLANGARMVLVESLSRVPTLIGGKHILLNYMIMRLDMSST